MSPIPQPFELFDAVGKLRTNHGGIMTPAATLMPEGEMKRLLHRWRSVRATRQEQPA
jgi:hypothetical protein